MKIDLKFRLTIISIIILGFCAALQAQQGYSDEQLASINNRFNQRVRQSLFQLRGEPLRIAEKRDPLSPGRGRYVRHFSYSIVDFAMKSFMLGEQIDTANDALQEYAEFYIGDRITRNDRDSFYWAADVLCRIIEFYGSNGSKRRGLLKAQTEELLYEMMWVYAEENSYVDSLDEIYEVYANWRWGQMGSEPLPASAEVERSKTWDVLESENHHIMKFTTLWHFARLLSERAEYQDRQYKDGHTAAEHYAAWSEYALSFCRERAKRGFFIEMADDGYNAHSLKGFFNLYDFTENEQLREVVGNFLTLYFASWAQEQIDGIRGGGKSRMNGLKGLRTTTPITNMMWFYVAKGEAIRPHGEYFTIMTSDYRLPKVVMDMVLDVEGRGNYEVADSAPGLAEKGFHGNPHYRLRTDHGGIVRYSYCTPDFVMGLPIVEALPFEDWTMISSQSRWQGVIFAGDVDARIFPECKPEDEGSTFNQQWGVQRKGTMISQRLKEEFTRGTEGMKIWVSSSLENPREQDGWIFFEAQGAYAAARAARGGYEWTESEVAPRRGSWITFEDGFSPAIIEVAQKTDYDDFDGFVQAVISLPLDWDGDRLSFTGLSGDEFSFYADYSQSPEINGEVFNYAPEKVFDSPFVNSKRESGIVIISKADRELVLDFNKNNEN